ncbi:MAG: methyltransferase domain-containing protein [Candidatus Latescibacterota bacterium]
MTPAHQAPGRGDHEVEAWGLRVLRPSHPELRRLRGRLRPQRQGHRAWNATWLLVDYLVHYPPPAGARVVDVGCGWGLVGIFCARRFAARVTGVDADARVFPYLQIHTRLNGVEVETLRASFEEVPEGLLAPAHVLVGADICFAPGMVQPLRRLLGRALACGTRRVVLADPGRPAFRQLAACCVDELGAAEREWEAAEPLVDWPGAAPRIRGRLLLAGAASGNERSTP